jgi:hypothetical protein
VLPTNVTKEHGSFNVFSTRCVQSIFLCERARYFWFAVLLLFFVEPNQILSRITNLTIQTRTTVLSRQELVHKRGKKRYQHFLYPVDHLNQRKSPSAQKSRKVPEVTDLSISCGWGWLVAEVYESWGCSCCARVRGFR